MVAALNDHARPCWYRNDEADEGTSATGARSLFTPAHARARPVAIPWLRAVDALPCAPMSGGAIVGGAQGIRRTAPPSWSVEMRRGGWPPAAATAWSFELRPARDAGVVTLSANRTTPPISPRPIRPRRLGEGVAPDIATISF